MEEAIQQEQQVVHKKKMRPWIKWSLISLVIVLLVVASLLLYVNAYINRSLADTEGTKSVSGLNEQVEILRDENGVPHITASNDYDLFFAQGYVTAQDRLFQMEMARRQASGELSEVAGEVALNQDKYFRTLGLRRAAEKSLELYDEESIKVLEAYADGVNQYIQEVKKDNKFPVEFKLMGVEGMDEWTVIDSLTIGKYMAYDLGGHWERQAFNYYLMHNFNEEEAYELFPTYPEDGLTNISDEEYVDITANLTQAPKTHEFNGSNNWVVSGDKTDSGLPLLSNDPHLGLATPSIWYQVHLDSDKYNVSGVIFAGIPGVILGHNEDVAWGVTNVGPDVQQLYLEQRHEDDPHKFKYEDEWVEAEVITETIEIKDQDPVEYEVIETIHGPVISEFANNTGGEEAVFSLDWTALDATPELSAVLKINRAKNWEEFEKALEDFHAPAQNFVFASKDGTIAYKANGKIPKYDDPDHALLPLPGWNSEYDLDEFIPFDELPRIVNPEKGFVATANNKVISDEYPYHISHMWAQPYRYTRIHEVLQESDSLSIEDMKDLQMDQMNLQARQFTPIFTDILENTQLSSKEQKAIDSLKSWNYVDDADNPQPLIFHRLLKHIEDELFADEIPEEVLSMFKGSGQNLDQLIMKAYEGKDVLWFEKNGGLEQVISNAFTKTIDELEEMQGENMSEWAWGDYHQVYFAHPLSNISILDEFFNPIEPVPVGGSNVTVMAASFKDNGITNHGASWRFVIDLENINQAHHIVGPGQAGHYRSKWYDNQIMDWVEGNYHLTKMDVNGGKRLVLKPE
ncbi:penicillin acylase family protein [Filobacillus milosensis]|uniref:Penicillin acylase family protein n=1 Tax=Filobacillus milosensis TaxID=94137 RepID=A0A4Y8IDQ5_9BACI|nr:penicillin acylase family protein [Filobacillus milosensis]TFB14076.1 penicillin acylase family protein [Filobacillus milosensis]